MVVKLRGEGGTDASCSHRACACVVWLRLISSILSLQHAGILEGDQIYHEIGTHRKVLLAMIHDYKFASPMDDLVPLPS